MKKRIITISLAMFALVATQNVNAAGFTQQQLDGIERIGLKTKDRPADKEFKFDQTEITFDVTGEAELVLPKLLNPHKLQVEGIGTDNSAAFTEFEFDPKTFEITKYTPNRAFIGDVTLYATAKKSSKYGPSEARCVIHFIDTSIFKTIDFKAQTPEDQANNIGNSNGWLSDSNDQPCWYCVSGGLWAYGAWAGTTSYIEKYMISPVMELEAGNYQYQVEIINTLWDFGEHQDWARVVVRESGSNEWIDLGDIAFPDAEHKWNQISSGKLNVPVELTGKSVEFGLKYATDGTTIGNWTISEMRFGRVDADLTGIKNVEVKNEVKDNKVYDLQGRLVKNPTHGIYIKNSKKFVIK